MVEEPIKGAAVKTQDRLEETVGEAFHPRPALPGFMLAQKPRAHEWSEGERDKTRRKNRNDDCDGELPKNPAEQSRHKSERNKDGSQRQRHRQNGERNFAGAVQGRAINRFAVLRPPDHVFQKHDGVIDEKTDGESQRHQRQVVDRVIERPHDEERQQDGERQRHHRDERVARAPEKDEDDKHDENERDEERGLHVGDRMHNAERTVERRNEVDRARQFEAHLR